MTPAQYALKTIVDEVLVHDPKGPSNGAAVMLEAMAGRAVAEAQEAMQARCTAFVADYNWEGMLAIGYRPSAVALICAQEMAKLLKPGEME